MQNRQIRENREILTENLRNRHWGESCETRDKELDPNEIITNERRNAWPGPNENNTGQARGQLSPMSFRLRHISLLIAFTLPNDTYHRA